MDYEEKIEKLEKENALIKAQLEKQTQAKAAMICAVFFASFMSVSLLIYLFFDKFSSNEGIFAIEVVTRGFSTGCAILVWSFIQKILFGDPLKDCEVKTYPQIEKNKEYVMTFLLVALIYAAQLIGYFIFAK